ncbi:acyl-CoA dehydrogenase family protein [Nocardia sp. NPDC059240]|uniref:acyl-CoA dehydrogenase family protein n=1 Tax=Nocardia sp. NPDC059240 TaxID=3346786 RepID=UPI0036B47781
MTTQDLFSDQVPAERVPTASPVWTEYAPTVAALQQVIFGKHIALHTRVRDLVVGLSDLPRSGATYGQEATYAPDLLRAVIAGLGRPARDIAADTQLRGALCDWAQVASPRLLLVLTGHFDLAIGAILALGNQSQYQQDCLAELDSGAALGVLMLTELGGTNGADQQTTATWDPTIDGFLLTTPSAAAIKFMPNVADPATSKTAVVTARLIVDGKDEGVLPFLLKLRTADGLAEGVDVVPLPDKGSAPMDHAMIRFTNVRLPRAALLGGDWASIDAAGHFDCALPPRRRFHEAVAVLGNGRLDLANAAIASARAALTGLVNYTRQRRPGAGILMADRDAVQRELVSAVTTVYATSALGRRIRDMRADDASADPAHAMWSMLAKPLLSNTAHQVLLMCRQRAAAQGALRINHLLDWIGNLEAIITAEGENQILQVTAGKRAVDGPPLRLPGASGQLPWYIDLLDKRERALSADLRDGTFLSNGVAPGPDSAAIELATAIAERLAATALYSAVQTASDPTARLLIASAAAAYGLDRIHTRAAWYISHGHLTPDRAAELAAELHRHHRTLIPNLATLVAAFAIPALPGPIFTTDYIRAWQDHAGWDDTSFTDH